MPDEIDSLFPDLQGLLTADWGNSPGSPLSADPEHGGVSAESLDAFLRENAGRPLIRGVQNTGGGTTTPQAPVVAETPPPSPGEGDGEELDEGEAPPPEPAPAPPPTTPPAEPPIPEAPDVIAVGDQVITRAQLEALARLQRDVQMDPRLQAVLTQYYTGQPAPAPAPPGTPAPAYVPEAPAPPPLTFSEDDDPRFVRLMQLVAAQQDQISRLASATQSIADTNIARSNADAQALVDRAAASFQEQHGLTAEETKRIRLSASRMGAFEALMQGFDPITGVPQRPDILEATDRALEIAYYADPQLRQRMIDEAIAQNRERNRHRQKLAGVGGSSGAVSRTPAEPPRPGTPASHSALVEEVGQMLAGTWTEPGR